MRPSKSVQYALFAGVFFGVALSVAVLGDRSLMNTATAVAIALLGCSAAALAVIADDEARR